MTTTSNNFGAIELTPGQQHHINIVSVSHNPPSRSLPLHLPRRDLLDGSEDFNEICVPLYNASTTGDLEAAKLILDKRPELVQFSLTESYETTFHIAVLGKSYMFVQYLTSLMTKEDLEIRNGNGETCLYLVARAGNVEIAKILVEKNEGLIDIPDSREKMPLYVAALFGRHHMVEYLYNISQKMTGNFWTHQKRSCVLEKCVETDLFDVALRMVIDTPELAINGSVLRLLARKPFAFHSQGSHIHLKAILLGYMPRPEDEEIGPKDEETEALQLLRIILKDIMKLPKTKIDEITRGPPDEDAMQKYSSRVLFLATEMGNTPFVVEAIRQYPHLAHEVNDDNQSIFHVAVSHRHKGIYKLLYEKGHIRDSIITLEDKNGNNMLHLVGESARGNRLPNISGMGLRTRLELLWFKEVERMLPSHLCEKKNAAGLTPHELFIKNHKDLFSKEEKMMKQMATQLMVVEALVATISFAAIFTFPGGYNQNTGIPIFLPKTLSKIFIMFNSLSFLSSTTSILIVLSIIMSDLDAYDFTISSPRQVKLCLALVFFSIATIILTFLTSLFLLYQSISLWMPIFISTFALVPYMAFSTLNNGSLNHIVFTALKFQLN